VHIRFEANAPPHDPASLELFEVRTGSALPHPVASLACLASLIGREDDIAAASRLLRETGVRLLIRPRARNPPLRRRGPLVRAHVLAGHAACCQGWLQTCVKYVVARRDHERVLGHDMMPPVE
jgi:hypothetical protein